MGDGLPFGSVFWNLTLQHDMQCAAPSSALLALKESWTANAGLKDERT